MWHPFSCKLEINIVFKIFVFTFNFQEFWIVDFQVSVGYLLFFVVEYLLLYYPFYISWSFTVCVYLGWVNLVGDVVAMVWFLKPCCIVYIVIILLLKILYVCVWCSPLFVGFLLLEVGRNHHQSLNLEMYWLIWWWHHLDGVTQVSILVWYSSSLWCWIRCSQGYVGNCLWDYCKWAGPYNGTCMHKFWNLSGMARCAGSNCTGYWVWVWGG